MNGVVSVVILTANESSTIERSLKSVLWSDDIIIIDNSQDDTIKKAKKIISEEKLRIFTDKTTDDFSYLRNKGIAYAKHDWIFFLDADENVSKELQEEIQSVTKAPGKLVGFYVKRHDYFLGKQLKHGETASVSLLKLGKKGNGLWKRSVHEKWEIQGSTTILKNPLLHFPHPTIVEFLQHINRWTTLDAQEFFANGVRSSYIKILAYPTAKFIRNYIVHLGFLDGIQGLMMAIMMSFHSFLTRAKLYMLQTRA